jgi:hypothetical protein
VRRPVNLRGFRLRIHWKLEALHAEPTLSTAICGVPQLGLLPCYPAHPDILCKVAFDLAPDLWGSRSLGQPILVEEGCPQLLAAVEVQSSRGYDGRYIILLRMLPARAISAHSRLVGLVLSTPTPLPRNGHCNLLCDCISGFIHCPTPPISLCIISIPMSSPFRPISTAGDAISTILAAL